MVPKPSEPTSDAIEPANTGEETDELVALEVLAAEQHYKAAENFEAAMLMIAGDPCADRPLCYRQSCCNQSIPGCPKCNGPECSDPSCYPQVGQCRGCGGI